MTNERAAFNILVDQRHFYFIALRDIGGYRLSDYWEQAGNIVMPGQKSTDVIDPEFEIQHRRLRSAIPYPRGKTLEAVSVSGDKSAPYLYDIFALRIIIGTHSYFIFAFPFAALAREVIDRLIETYHLQRKCDILKVDLPLLIKNRELQSETGEMRAHLVGLRVVISGDPALSSLSLGGDDPLESAIYRNYLQRPISEGSTILEQCVLACELEYSFGSGDPVKPRKLRTRMHIDAFGNFKFYVHINGENFIIVPYLLKQLRSLNCLNNVSVNPLHRVQEQLE